MNLRILATPALLIVFSGALPAVDSQLLNLVMPDAKLLAGVNVAQAKATPFGQFVLSQLSAHESDLQQLATITGFDPRRDVSELLVASNAAPGAHTGLVTATGTFNVAAITAAASTHGGSTENYQGVTILEDPKKTHGIAFLTGSLVAAGDLADVKAAIDRQKTPPILPTSLTTQVSTLSSKNDAWGLMNVPPSTLAPAGTTAPQVPGVPNGLGNALQSVQAMSGGVKFGANVLFSGQAQTDTAQNATSLAGIIQFLANMAQLQSQNNPQAAAALQTVTANAQGTTVTVSMTVPEDQFQQMLSQNKAHQAGRGPRTPHGPTKK